MKKAAGILILLTFVDPLGGFAAQPASPREVSAAGQSEAVLKSQIKTLADRQRKVNADMSERLKQIEKQNPELAFQYKGQMEKLRTAQKRMGLAAESLEKNDLDQAFAQQTQFFQEATYIFVEGVNYFREEKEKQAMPLGTFLDRQGDQVHYPKEKKMTLGQKPFFDAEKFKPSDVVTHSYKEIEDSDSNKQSHLEVPEFGKPKIFGQKPDSEPQKKASGAEEGSQGSGGLKSKNASVRKPASGALAPKSAGSEKQTELKPGDQDALKSGRTEAADDLNAKNAEVKAGGGGAGAGAGAGGGDGGMIPQGDGMLPDGKGENPSLQRAAGWVPPGTAGAGNAVDGSLSGASALVAGGLSESKGNSTGGTSAGESRGNSTASSGSALGLGSGHFGIAGAGLSGGNAAVTAGTAAGVGAGGSSAVGTANAGSVLTGTATAASGTAGRGAAPSGHGALGTTASAGAENGTAQTAGAVSQKNTASSGANKPEDNSLVTAGNGQGQSGLGSAGKGEENAPLAKINASAETAGGMGSGYALSGMPAAEGQPSRTSSGLGQKNDLGTVPPGAGLLDQGASAGKALAQGEASGAGTINLLEDAAKITGSLGLQDAGAGNSAQPGSAAGEFQNKGALPGDSKTKANLDGASVQTREKLKPSGETPMGTSPQGDVRESSGTGQSAGILAAAQKDERGPSSMTANPALSGGHPSTGPIQKEKVLSSSIAREENGFSSKSKAESAGQGPPPANGAFQKKEGLSNLEENKKSLQGLASGGELPQDQNKSEGKAGALGTAQAEKSAGASSQDKKETLNPPQKDIRTSGDSRGPERRGLASSGVDKADSSASGTSGLEAGNGGPVGTAGGQSGSGFPGGSNASGPGLQKVPPADTELFQDNLKSGPPQSGSSAGQKDNTAMPQTLRTEQTAVQPKDERAREANNVAAIHEWLLQERLLIQELKKFKPVKQVNNPNPPWEFYLLRQKQMLNQIRQLRRRIEFYGTKDEYFMELHKVSKIANRLLELLNAGEFTDYAIAGTSLEDLLEDIRMTEAALPPAEGRLFNELSAPEQRVPDSYKPVVSRYFERLSRQ